MSDCFDFVWPKINFESLVSHEKPRVAIQLQDFCPTNVFDMNSSNISWMKMQLRTHMCYQITPMSP